MRQEKYVASLRVIGNKFFAVLKDEQIVSDQAKSHYSMLLDGVSWICLAVPPSPRCACRRRSHAGPNRE
eukprot:4871411-Pyramimonas_sp.AAC.1